VYVAVIIMIAKHRQPCRGLPVKAGAITVWLDLFQDSGALRLAEQQHRQAAIVLDALAIGILDEALGKYKESERDYKKLAKNAENRMRVSRQNNFEL